MGGRETIVALSSGQGAAGVAVLRVSGKRARDVLEALGAKHLQPRYAKLVELHHSQGGQFLDQALTLFFPAPNSFTGEDIAELHIHGSRAVQAIVIDAILAVDGSIRLAVPGEFTRRALENGKLDLAQVEGLAALIDSETEWQRQQALRLMSGELSRMTDQWRAALVDALAFLDAGLDFSDEGDVADDALLAQVPALIEPVIKQLAHLLATASGGERLRDGFRVAIIGAPNAGKSSLLNAIAKRDVAIVSHIAGTTRDVIEVRCDIDGLPITFLDTAGLRESDDPVEIEGMTRARAAAREADLVILLRAVDSVTEQYDQLQAEYLEVTTKIDLAATLDGAFGISAKDGRGIEQLLLTIAERIKGSLSGEPVLVSEQRQRIALARAYDSLSSARQRIGNHGVSAPELAAEDVRLACRALDSLIGRVNVDDVLDQIFSRMCIGK
ncbi:MAG: tRNA uridine-5-carboxymethylaminomethyl(34) synthesis GTPase MnmE [Bosea sp. (in: a-proteobacteria)]